MYIYIIWLVVLTILKHIIQLGRIIPYIMENKTCLKPPTSNLILRNMGSSKLCSAALWWRKRPTPTRVGIKSRVNETRKRMWNYSTRHIQSYRKHSMTPCHYHRYYGINVSKTTTVFGGKQFLPTSLTIGRVVTGSLPSGSSMPKEKQRPMVKYPFLLPIDIHCT